MNAFDDEDDDWELLMVVAQTVMNQNAAVVLHLQQQQRNKRKTDHRTLPRSTRRKWRHDEALHCIGRDYLGLPDHPDTPLFVGKNFEMMFRVSRPRFEKIMQDFANSGIPFYQCGTDCFGNEVASLEARMLLPLKTLAYGVPPHCFCDYFQMSPQFARDACKTFAQTVKALYEKEYLRLPTKTDMKNIINLHRDVHDVEGMFGSLDCMHTYWKNCPKAWQGQYKKGGHTKSMASIVLEAISDYHLWFWHASYGYAGTLNDLNVLNMSPFLSALVDGSFAEVESPVVPYRIGQEEFHKCLVLVDGIYPNFSRFVKGIKEPVSIQEKRFTEWQESARKDIERAFGVLQAMWQWTARPIHQHNLKDITARLACCMILHNMCVSDRVMDGDVNARYDPSNSVEAPQTAVAQSQEAMAQQAPLQAQHVGGIGVPNMPEAAARLALQRQEWRDLTDNQEHVRLFRALMEYKNK